MSFRKSIRILFWIVIILLVGMRFWHLDADFPQGITNSGVLYTDEGWWSNNAVAYILTGNWYVTGDYNPAVNLPVFPLIQVLSFKLFGISLNSARLTDLIFFVMILALLYYTLKTHGSSFLAKASILLVSLNSLVFAYSRLALLELPLTFFTLLALFLTLEYGRTQKLGYIIAAAGAFVFALLTKTTAVFILPVLGYILLSTSASISSRVHKKNYRLLGKTLFLFSFTVGALLFCYWLFLVQPYPQDFYNFTKTSTLNNFRGLQFLSKAAANVKAGVLFGSILDHILYAFALISGPFVLAIKPLRRNVLLVSAFGWLYIYLFIISVSGYFPPRYYVPLMIPVAVIAASMLEFLIRKKRFFIAGALLLVLTLSGLNNVSKMAYYMNHLEYSFFAMAQDVRKIVEADKSPLLIGTFANTVSLATGIPSINLGFGTENLADKIKRYHPNYLITLDPIPKEIEADYRPVLLKRYNVFSNYYTGGPVLLYRLEPRQKG